MMQTATACVTITLATYSHVLPNMQREAADQGDALLLSKAFRQPSPRLVPPRTSVLSCVGSGANLATRLSGTRPNANPEGPNQHSRATTHRGTIKWPQRMLFAHIVESRQLPRFQSGTN